MGRKRSEKRSQPSVRGRLGSRPPLERMLRIHQAIRAGRFPNGSKLARELEVSSKSIHRDLDFMRDRLGLPLEYDPQRFGYYYTEEVSSFPTLQITEGELFSLVVAEKAVQQYRGTSFEKPLLSALQKLASAMPDTISLSLSDWDHTISFRTSVESLVDLEIFDKLAKAAAGSKQLRLVYRKPGQKHGEERVVDPYHLANINGEWFLFAYDYLRRDLRTFAPARIVSVAFTGKVFQRPKSFSLEERLAGSFGVHSGAGQCTVVLACDPSVADYIREKRWHPSQELRELDNGGVEIRLRLSSLVEIQRWIMGWGGRVRVLEPKELAEGVQEWARSILANTG